MKNTLLIFICSTICLILSVSRSEAQATPGDEFIRIYANLERADREKTDQNLVQSKALFAEALEDLKSLQTVFPEWKPKVIAYRIRYAQQMLKQVEAEIADLQKAEFGASEAANVDPESQAQRQETEALKSNVERLLREKALLEAQLREAFAARPAAVEPDRLREAESTIDELKAELEATRRRLDDAPEEEGASSDSDGSDSSKGSESEEIQNLRNQLEALEGIEAAWKERQPYLESRIQTMTVEWQAANNKVEELERRLKALQTAASELNSNPTTQGDPELESQLTSARARVSELSDQLASSESIVATLRSQLVDQKNQISRLTEKSETAPGDTEIQKELDRVKARLAVFEAEKVPYNEEELQLFTIPQPNDPIFMLSSTKDEKAAMRDVKMSRQTRLDIESARKSLESGNQTIAIRLFQDIVARELRWIAIAESGLLIARASDYKSTMKRAEQVWSGVNDEKLRQFGLLFTKAWVQMTEGDFEEAISTYQAVLDVQEDPYVWKDLALAYWNLERYELAESAVRQGLALQERHAESYYVLGIIRMSQRRIEEAIDYLSQSVRIRPDFFQAYSDLGQSMYIAGYQLAGENSLRKALLIAPDYFPAHANLAAVYINQDPPLPALAQYHYQKSVSLGGPENPDLKLQIDLASKLNK